MAARDPGRRRALEVVTWQRESALSPGFPEQGEAGVRAARLEAEENGVAPT